MTDHRHHIVTPLPDTDPTTGSAAGSALATVVPDERHEEHPGGHPLELDDVSSAALRLWVILSRAHAAIAAHATADAARHGLTLAEFAILEALYHRGPMLLGEVQRRILVSSGGITFLVDRLTAKGLVERRNCEADRRARYAALTARGEELVAEIFPMHAAAVTRSMSALGPEEQHRIADALRVLGREAADQPLPGAGTSARGRREG